MRLADSLWAADHVVEVVQVQSASLNGPDRLGFA